MILTLEQEQAAEAIRRFITDDNQTLVLHGLAGTGKTTVLTAIANEYPDAKLCAYTGKAASVLRAKSGLKACTVHSLFYRLVDKGTDERRASASCTFSVFMPKVRCAARSSCWMSAA